MVRPPFFPFSSLSVPCPISVTFRLHLPSSACLLLPLLQLQGVLMQLCYVVSGRTESWGLKLLRYLLCLQGSDTEEKESRSSVTSSPNDKQIDLALWLWQSKQG